MAATLLASLKPISCVAVTSKQKQIDGILRSIGKGQQVGFECLQMMAISTFLNTQQMDGVYRRCKDSSVSWIFTCGYNTHTYKSIFKHSQNSYGVIC